MEDPEKAQQGGNESSAPGDEPAPNPERQEKAREYARIRRRWMLAQILFSLALLLIFWLTGLSRAWESFWVDRGITNPWAVVALYFLTLELAATLVFLPVGWWTGFVLPHRYELSTQTLPGWLLDQVKSLGMEIALGIPVVEVIYWLLRTQPNTWWLWGAGLMIVLNVVLGALAPVLLVPIFYKLTPLEDKALVDRIKSLARRTGTRIAEVDTINLSARTTAANAMVMGLGRTKRIALGDTLYEAYSADEIEVILAHELGHQVHHDLELGLIVQTATTFIAFYVANLTLQWGVARFGFSGIGDPAAVPLVALVGTLLSIPALPLVNGFSRWREHLADLYALQVATNPGAFATAMTRLMNQNLAEADPPRWVVWLLYDHPPIRERIALARRGA